MQIFSFDFPRCRITGLLIFLTALLLGLSACGGGGGGSSGFSSDGTSSGDVPSMTSGEQNAVDSSTGGETSSPSNQNAGNGSSGGSNSQQAFRFPSKAKVPEISSAIWEAAKARAGFRYRSYSRSSQNSHVSMTQTSEPAAQGGDAVLFEWFPFETTDGSYERRAWISFYTDNRGRALVGQRERSVSDIVQTKIRNENGHAWADMAFYRKWTADDVSNSHFFDRYAAYGPGEIWVYAYTDADGDGDGTPGEHSDEADSDYLAGGVWVYVPETFVDCSENTLCNEHEVGTFLHGNDPFETQSMWALEGTATYDGRAVGIFTGTGRQTYFRASAEVTAYFGSSTNPGAIRGRIFDFVGENGSRMSGNPVVQLQSGISFNNVEYVLGSTTHNDGTNSFTGQWTGHFYGNSHASGIPTSLGGTFGTSTPNGSKVYLGSFGSHLDTYDATDFTLP